MPDVALASNVPVKVVQLWVEKSLRLTWAPVIVCWAGCPFDPAVMKKAPNDFVVSVLASVPYGYSWKLSW
ncbi:MAG: hypothetical protein AUI15_22115 [Actinobacteria bacterium 13_2_20CM_2_66_6]|nr:MAG: hypothetical protein AUI15_22115 [Actinobacteria bacterium 13_2_20CM_2_66_6]